MAQRTRANFKSTKNSRFTTNGTGAITGAITNDMFEDVADSVVMFEDLGSTSTSDLLKFVKVTIPSASILTANSSPVTLVAAQGVGTIIQPISVQIFYDYNSAAYATNTNMQFFISTALQLGYGSVLNQTQDIYGSALFTPTYSNVNMSNQPLTWTVETGNPTAGDSPLYLYLTYRIITL